MGVSESTLLCESSLNSLLERSPICDSAEDPRNELRIIDVTEAEERLVLLAEVDIHSGVKRIAVFV